MHFTLCDKAVFRKKPPKGRMLLLKWKNKGGIGYQKADSRQHNPVSSFLGKSIRQYTIKYVCIRLYRIWRVILISPLPSWPRSKKKMGSKHCTSIASDIPHSSLHLHCQAETFPCKCRQEYESSYGTPLFHCMCSLGPRSSITHIIQ